MGTRERKEREKKARRTSILNAARAIFFAKGLESTTVDEIAEAAELSKGGIYLYFRSKEDIYFSLMDEGLNLLLAEFQKIARRQKRADQLLLEIIQAYYRFYRRHTAYFHILFLFQHSNVRSRIAAELFHQGQDRGNQCMAIVANLIQRGIDQKIFRAADPCQVALIGWSTLNGVIMLAEQEPGNLEACGTSLSGMVQAIGEFLLHSLKVKP